MKSLIVLVVGLMAVGCGKNEVEKLVGSYEAKTGRKFVLLENGKAELYVNGKKKNDGTWKMAGKEVHVGDEEATGVYKIEPNGDLTAIAVIVNGKREAVPKEQLANFTYKKLYNQPSKGTNCPLPSLPLSAIFPSCYITQDGPI